MECIRVVKAGFALFVSLAFLLSIAPAPSHALTCSDTYPWTSKASLSGGARRDHSAIWDAANSRMIVFGGFDGTNTLGDVWAYSPSSNAWTQITATGGPARRNHGAIYDAPRQRMLVYGGTGTGANSVHALSLGATPAWSTLSTTGSPPSFVNHATIYDSNQDAMMVALGSSSSATWKLSLGTNAWQQVTSSFAGPALDGPTAVYDAANQRMVLFGGQAHTGGPYCSPSDVDQDASYALPLDGTPSPSWSQISTSGSISARAWASSFYDPQCLRMIVFGGVSNLRSCFGGQSSCATDSYYGADGPYALSLPTSGTPTWTALTTSGGPVPARGRTAAVYDPARNRMFTFGGWELIEAFVPPGSCTVQATETYRNDTWHLGLPDVTLPALTTLWADPNCEDITLGWTAPGDDSLGGHAYLYDLRWSTSAITAGNFSSATPISVSLPGASGRYEQYVDYLGACSAVRHYAIRTRDQEGNFSLVSNSASAQTVCPQPNSICIDDEFRAHPAVPEARTLTLSPARPNPTNSSVAFDCAVAPELADVVLDVSVFDSSGRRLASLYHGSAISGTHRLAWDLTRSDGTRAAPGLYFVRLQSGTTNLMRPVIVTR